jgi:hypothetical protein
VAGAAGVIVVTEAVGLLAVNVETSEEATEAVGVDIIMTLTTQDNTSSIRSQLVSREAVTAVNEASEKKVMAMNSTLEGTVGTVAGHTMMEKAMNLTLVGTAGTVVGRVMMETIPSSETIAATIITKSSGMQTGFNRFRTLKSLEKEAIIRSFTITIAASTSASPERTTVRATEAEAHGSTIVVETETLTTTIIRRPPKMMVNTRKSALVETKSD